MNADLITLFANVIVTPILVLLTLWAKSAISSSERHQNREDAYFKELVKRVENLEKEIRELRVELKNRDAEYVKLYQEHATLRAKYEVLKADYDITVKEFHATQAELTALKEQMKTKVAAEIQKL